MKNRPQHNFSDGPISACQVCGSHKLELVLDLGCQPLCDSLLSEANLSQPETSYPLRQVWCQDCTLSQLDYVVPGNVVYHEQYPYRTGVTLELVEYQQQMASDLVGHLSIPQGSLVVDVGCNDGTLLQAFRAHGMRVAGVEPTGIAKFAVEAGVPTVQAPFNVAAAQQILETNGPAKIVTATNVFAHMATLGDVMEALEILVARDGYFVLENHYLLDVMERLQFDTIYHEHLRTYSLRSLITLFGFYDFQVVDAQRVSRYGGNIRVIAARGGGHPVSDGVSRILEAEATTLTQPDYYRRFRDRSFELKDNLLSLAITCKKEGQPLIGNSCPGRCSTLLNFAGIGPDLIPWLAEQPTSLKLGQYLPGRHIPVVDNQRLIDEQPRRVLLLAWHYAQPIAEQLRARGLKSEFYVPLPEVQKIDI